MENKIKQVFYELKQHAPFTALATAVAILIAFVVLYFFEKTISEEGFHLFHFLHVIASATVTAGIFYKYKPRIVPALLIGILGAIIIGSISDVVFPYFGWVSLNIDIHFHLPLIEKTVLVLLSALVGSLAGILIRTTKCPHFIHVFFSVFASLFYLLSFTLVFSPSYFIAAFFVVFAAVIIPCCLSDIVFPFFFLPGDKKMIQ